MNKSKALNNLESSLDASIASENLVSFLGHYQNHY